MRAEILKAAREIMQAESLDSISVRKIAAIIEYSPAIIYHYFKNKDEIIEKMIEEDYAKIIQGLSRQANAVNPQERLRKSLTNYITTAVQMGDLYKSMMLTQSPTVLAKTSVLQPGASAERPAVAMLCNGIRESPALAGRDELQVEAMAQIIWSTVFGLAMRIIVEKIDDAQKQKLIGQASEFISLALDNGRA